MKERPGMGDSGIRIVTLNNDPPISVPVPSASPNVLPADLDPRVALQRSRDALRGAIQEGNVAEVRKMVTIILAPLQADVSISAEGFRVDFGFQRGPLSYWPKLAGPTLREICRSHLDAVSPRFRLRAADISRIRMGESKSDRWIWVFEEPMRILLFSRVADQEVQPDSPVQLDRWVAARRVWAVFDEPRVCPHCGVSRARFRAVEGALICQVCGRSWSVNKGVFEDALLETDG